METERRLVYADASALAKLVVDEAETEALKRALAPDDVVVTSALARVEVTRAVKAANGSDEALHAAGELIDGCIVIDVADDVLRAAASLVSPRLRTLDAVHLASAKAVGPDEILVYDRRLADAARNAGLATAAPGAS